MSAKQDRTYTRTASDLERKLNLKEKFSQVMGVAEDAQKAAEEAKENYVNLDQETVFNLLTNNGQSKGIFKGDDGEIYINASYLASGIISSSDGKIQINLQGGTEPVFNTGISTNGLKVRGDSVGAATVFTLDAKTINVNGIDLDTFRFLVQDTDGNLLIAMNELFDKGLQPVGAQFRLCNDARTRMIDIKAMGDASAIVLEDNTTETEAGRFGMGSDGASLLNVTIINDKTVSWKDNGDGTFTLIGT